VQLLIDTLKGAIVVPTASVQRGPQGTFVYIVDGDKVKVRPVKVTQQDDKRAVIASGVAAGDQVVISGFAQLTDDAKITIGSANGETPAADAAPEKKKRGEGKRKRSENQ
jgi:multidrug efflux system membrane fusion protein